MVQRLSYLFQIYLDEDVRGEGWKVCEYGMVVVEGVCVNSV